MLVFDGGAGFFFRLGEVCRKHRSVGPPSGVNRRQSVKLNGSAVFSDAFVARIVVAEVSAREFFLERVLQIVGVPEQFVAVELGAVDHSQNRSVGQLSGRHIHPRQVGIVGVDRPRPRRCVGLVVVVPLNVLIRF